MNRIADCLKGKENSYLMPFLWLHGESHAILSEELDAIQQCGICEFCAESRTHEDFGKEKWWEDFGFLLEEAKRRGMRVWLLDDKRFPTGYANGWFETHTRIHKRRFLKEYHMDASGPSRDVAVGPFGIAEDHDPIAVLMCRRSGVGDDLQGDVIDLTDCYRDGLVHLSVPDGIWRIFFLYFSEKGQPNLQKSELWIDMLRRESCEAMLQAVYEPHYEHFASYFGNTFAGFFSDEPSFANGAHSYEHKLGREGHILPWRDDLLSLIAQNANVSESELFCRLPALWYNMGEKTALIRSHYMDTVTKLYRDNFSHLLGNWCRDHGVLYIGHVIEDENTHMRLGYGAGHFFRALEGQDMAGADIVLNQLVPGHTEMSVAAPISARCANPEFFMYTLAKLAASAAHIEPRKQGRAMCEMYGAFGWAEGTPMMRQLTDHMLVSGIHYFVPHAFSPKENDVDCPPHFYAGGRNPQFAAFGSLMRYTQRMSHVLYGGTYQADVAVFYNAEGEWSGGRNVLFQKIAKVLTQNQILFDFVPEDCLHADCVHDRCLWLNGVCYRALIVSESEVLPLALLRSFASLAASGLPVIFTDSLPHRASEEWESISGLLSNFESVPLDNLTEVLRRRNMTHIRAESAVPLLQCYHTKRDNCDIFMFRNADIYHEINTQLDLSVCGSYTIYDAWKNRVFCGKTDGTFHCRLDVGDSVVVCFGGDCDGALPYCPDAVLHEIPLQWDIAVREHGTSDFVPFRQNSELFSVTSVAEMTRFAGEIRYRTTWNATGSETLLDLGTVGEIARVTLNGTDCGERICPPYRFEVGHALHAGANELEITVINNPVYRERDRFSRYMILAPSGMLGPVQAGTAERK